MIIRNEEKKDYNDVENLTREAFWNVYRPGCFEHYVLHKMRDDDCFIKDLDYCIEDNNKIVAHIAYARAYINDNGIKHEIAIFGPLSVLPEKQKQGYGSKLIEFTLQKAKELGFALVAITGNPEYYHRFGFESASKFGVFYEGLPKTEESPFFMIKILDKEKANNVKGIYSDPKVYMVDEKKVEEFDKKFPKKLKEKREGQLI